MSSSNEVRYYTPDMTEFHIGFRYDFKWRDTWSSEIATRQHFLSKLAPELANMGAEYRVKHLDFSDPPQLGWAVDDRGSYIFNKKVNNINYRLYVELNNIIYIVKEHPKFTNLDEMIYRGLCRNINELEKIMSLVAPEERVIGND